MLNRITKTLEKLPNKFSFYDIEDGESCNEQIFFDAERIDEEFYAIRWRLTNEVGIWRDNDVLELVNNGWWVILPTIENVE